MHCMGSPKLLKFSFGKSTQISPWNLFQSKDYFGRWNLLEETFIFIEMMKCPPPHKIVFETVFECVSMPMVCIIGGTNCNCWTFWGLGLSSLYLFKAAFFASYLVQSVTLVQQNTNREQWSVELTCLQMTKMQYLSSSLCNRDISCVGLANQERPNVLLCVRSFGWIVQFTCDYGTARNDTKIRPHREALRLSLL